MRWFHAHACPLALAVGVSACGDPADDASSTGRCLDAGLEACTPLYPPTFDEIYTRRLAPTCAAAAACHGPGGRGGLAFGTADEAYAALVDGVRVIPGATGCGVLVDRLTTASADEMMPPGAPLAAGEICAIRTWIDQGADR
jgi:hypothetical protein